MKAFVAATLLGCATPGHGAGVGSVVRPAGVIPLPGVAGRIDHLALDAKGSRLFVAALGNNSVEVVDLAAQKVAHSIRGLDEPQGLLFLAASKRLYVANGGDGSLRVFDDRTYVETGRIPFDGDADNLRYDAAAGRVYVGYGEGALGVVDPATNRVVGSVPLGAHPESFQLEARASRIFVNLPEAREIVVVDRQSNRVTAHWPLHEAAANFPLALDEEHRRVLVATRRPARLLLLDGETGAVVADAELHGDCDDLFLDAAHRRVIASCGEGFIDVFDRDRGKLRRIAALETARGARTSLLAGNRLFVAVPQSGGRAAEVREFDLADPPGM